MDIQIVLFHDAQKAREGWPQAVTHEQDFAGILVGKVHPSQVHDQHGEETAVEVNPT